MIEFKLAEAKTNIEQVTTQLDSEHCPNMSALLLFELD
jgi:hypothetical protein